MEANHAENSHPPKEIKSIDFYLLQSIDSVEDFLKDHFKSSANKLKKYFSKAFLNRSLGARQSLRLPLNFVNDGEINPFYEGDDIKILIEDDSFFVFIKNHNQHIHPLSYDEADNCLSWMRVNRPELLAVNKSEYDRGLLYRLDYETSGVVVYAKTQELYQTLRAGFSELVKEKIYHCWVHGHVKNEIELCHSFSSAESKGRRVLVAQVGVHSKEGTLSLKPEKFEATQDKTLLQIRLKTGLRHQIRAQLAFIGHPLVGDVFYGGRASKRLYLHASKYTINYAGESYIFEAKPHDFDGL